MQSTSSLSEDVRQPPYLCPVDLAKVLRATGADETERHRRLLSFCNGHVHAPMFAAFGAWLASRIGDCDGIAEKSHATTGSKEMPIQL